jgi:hypothetical protein
VRGKLKGLILLLGFQDLVLSICETKMIQYRRLERCEFPKVVKQDLSGFIVICPRDDEGGKILSLACSYSSSSI